ncbi:unnamed protein product [Amoebophrya sp. A25]|nr:unnamed protein product [Amoebophrya sp. A25]|eukprot:GSA25T00024535001.1
MADKEYDNTSTSIMPRKSTENNFGRTTDTSLAMWSPRSPDTPRGSSFGAKAGCSPPRGISADLDPGTRAHALVQRCSASLLAESVAAAELHAQEVLLASRAQKKETNPLHNYKSSAHQVFAEELSSSSNELDLLVPCYAVYQNLLELFDEYQCLHYVAAELPPEQLDRVQRDLVLQRLIKYPKKLFEVLSIWPSDAYSAEILSLLLQQALSSKETELLRASGALLRLCSDTEKAIIENNYTTSAQCLALLYEKQGAVLEGMRVLLDFQSVGVFSLLRRSFLYNSSAPSCMKSSSSTTSQEELKEMLLEEKFELLMRIDCDLYIAFLVDRYLEFPVRDVLDRLRRAIADELAKGSPSTLGTRNNNTTSNMGTTTMMRTSQEPPPTSAGYWRHVYLKLMLKKDFSQVREFADDMVEAFAQYEPEELLEFLKISTNYDIERALELCRQRELFDVQVYLLGRAGLSREALEILCYKVGDVPKAVKYVSQENSEQLWEQLIAFVAGDNGIEKEREKERQLIRERRKSEGKAEYQQSTTKTASGASTSLSPKTSGTMTTFTRLCDFFSSIDASMSVKPSQVLRRLETSLKEEGSSLSDSGPLEQLGASGAKNAGAMSTSSRSDGESGTPRKSSTSIKRPSTSNCDQSPASTTAEQSSMSFRLVLRELLGDFEGYARLHESCNRLAEVECRRLGYDRQWRKRTALMVDPRRELVLDKDHDHASTGDSDLTSPTSGPTWSAVLNGSLRISRDLKERTRMRIV